MMKLKKPTLFASAVILSVSLLSCSSSGSKYFSTVRCDPNSPMTSSVRPMAAVKQVSSSRGINVVYVQSDSSQLIVEAPEDIIGLIVTEIDKDELNIGATKNLGNCAKRVKVTVKAPMITEFDVSSGSSINIEGDYNSGIHVVDVEASSGAVFKAQTMAMGSLDAEASSGSVIAISGIKAAKAKADVSSGAAVNLGGTVESVDFEASSGGVLDAEALKASTGKISASSGGVVSSAVANPSYFKSSSGGSINNRR